MQLGGSSTVAVRPVVRDTRCCRMSGLPLPPVQSAGCQALDGFSLRGRSAQHTTPKYELREVHYPWHPLFGREVHVRGSLHKLGRSLCRCCLPGQEDRIGFQVPAWMLDRAYCALMVLRSEPATSLAALLELKQLCCMNLPSSVATASSLRQATPITPGGNANAKAQRRSRARTAQLVRVSPTVPSMGGLANGDPPSSHPSSVRTASQQDRPAESGRRGRRRKR